MNNLPKVVAQQHRGRALNPQLLDRKSDALPLSHCAIPVALVMRLYSFRAQCTFTPRARKSVLLMLCSCLS